MAGVGAYLGHVVHVTTSMLLLLATGDLLEGLVIGESLLRGDIIIVSTHKRLLAATSRADQLLLASVMHLLLMLIGIRCGKHCMVRSLSALFGLSMATSRWLPSLIRSCLRRSLLVVT